MNYCKKCGVEIPENETFCEQCKKHQFNFCGTFVPNTPVQEEPVVKETIVENIEPEEEQKENIEYVEVEEQPREETEYEKYKKINYVPDKPEEYIALELPGGHNVEDSPFIEMKKFFSELKNSFSARTSIKRKSFTRRDLISSLIMLGSVVGIGVLIFISSNIIYERVVRKNTEVNEEIIEVFVDENAPYYHYLDCNHIVDGKRYVKLEEYIAKELGYIQCEKGD